MAGRSVLDEAIAGSGRLGSLHHELDDLQHVMSDPAKADALDAALERFAAETRRAELVHWVNAAAGPLFLVWCPPVIGAVMVVFGPVVHLPFVCIQRSNRAQIERVLAARRARLRPTG